MWLRVWRSVYVVAPASHTGCSPSNATRGLPSRSTCEQGDKTSSVAAKQKQGRVQKVKIAFGTLYRGQLRADVAYMIKEVPPPLRRDFHLAAHTHASSHVSRNSGNSCRSPPRSPLISLQVSIFYRSARFSGHLRGLCSGSGLPRYEIGHSQY